MKKGSIELWRFVFTIGIAIMHFGHPNGFYIAVDFFFMLSGYLIANSVCYSGGSRSGSDIYTHKLKRLYPQYFVAYFLMLIWNIFIYGCTINETFCADAILELLFAQMLFPYTNAINGITWYVSALVICLPVVIALIKYHRHIYSAVIAPVIAVIAYSFLLGGWGHVDFGFVWLGYINGGLIRAVGGLSAGVFCYYISCRYEEQIKSIHKHLLSTMECLIGLIVIVCASNLRQTKMDAVLIILLAMLIVIAFHDNGWFAKLCDHSIIKWIGNLSYSIYLNQLFVGGIIDKLLGEKFDSTVCTILYVIVLILISILTDNLIRWIDKRLGTKKKVCLCAGVLIIVIVVTVCCERLHLIKKVSNDLHCSVDICNDSATTEGGEYVIKAKDEVLVLEGWAEKVSTNEIVDSIVVRCNGVDYEATMNVKRQDVAESLECDDLLESGWSVAIPIEEVKEDKDGKLEIRVNKDDEYKQFCFWVCN